MVEEKLEDTRLVFAHGPAVARDAAGRKQHEHGGGPPLPQHAHAVGEEVLSQHGQHFGGPPKELKETFHRKKIYGEVLLESAHELYADAAVGVVAAHRKRHETVAFARELQQPVAENTCVHHVKRDALVRKHRLHQLADQ